MQAQFLRQKNKGVQSDPVLSVREESRGSGKLIQVKEKLSAEEYKKFVEFMKALKSKEMKISQVLQSIVRLFSGSERLHLLERRECLPVGRRSPYHNCVNANCNRYSSSSRYLLGDVNSSFSGDVDASLSGEITRYLGNLSSLTHLDLGGNYNLSTKNLDWVSSLSSLESLYMGGVKINPTKADWLHAINMLPSLRELSLYSSINEEKSLIHLGDLEA
ncbi:hypothetical protein CMV_023505 [Castanea mollissima]|uniref:Uncharacterized protein n=1 Tax=Castanea mollissima TaxID=60419 RepID=A0A8J4QPD3_9ROSI|nr:hypothetical protein CMV_023505 [Castanea mollissima]